MERRCRSSTTTSRCDLAMRVVALWAASRRRAARCLLRLASRSTALRQRPEPLRLRETCRCRRARPDASACVGTGRWMRSPVDRVSELATPRSIPTAGPSGAAAAATSCSTHREANQCPPSRDTVILRMRPPSGMGRERRSLIQPSLGSLSQSPSRANCLGSGNRSESRPLGLKRGYSALPSKKREKAASWSRSVCCKGWIGASASQPISRRSSVRRAASATYPKAPAAGFPPADRAARYASSRHASASFHTQRQAPAYRPMRRFWSGAGSSRYR